MSWIKFAYDNRVALGAWFMAFLLAWVPMATLLAKFIRRPVAAAGWKNAMTRGLFDLFVDTPSVIAAIDRIGIFGGRWNFPGIPSRTADANPIKSDGVTLISPPPAAAEVVKVDQVVVSPPMPLPPEVK